MEIIFTHNNADFDAVASLLAAHKLYPSAIPVLPSRLNQNVSEFITLYQNGLPFVTWEDRNKSDHVDKLILVDTQRHPKLHQITESTDILIIDHHPLEIDLTEQITLICEVIGSTATLLVEELQKQHITVSSLEATLIALGIYSDTGSLTYERTTPRDIQAAAWALEQNAVLDTVRRFFVTPLTQTQQDAFDALLDAAEGRTIQGYMVTIAAIEHRDYVNQINTVTNHLNNLLDSDAIFVVVKMPKSTQMVCRSRTNAIDVGIIAKKYGGGGHARAAAAKITKHSLDHIIRTLWETLEQVVEPPVRVSDLMSHGVQTTEADDLITDIIQQLRRIGHEGYPVLEAGKVVGLLTRRDADRALEHGLEDTRVRDVMVAGEVTLTPDDSVSQLEQLMVQSGWGQIPIVDERDTLIGIITRTDLIKHWATVHPTQPQRGDHIPPEQVAEILGKPIAALIELVAAFARQQKISLYMVGGVVRDLLLKRPNFDIDFVVEGDAIAFAEQLQANYGGFINSFRPFGTAKWQCDEKVAHELGFDLSELPNHIDFATARNEFYIHPTALPSVYNSSIKLDLHRRDFTINTLAVQLSPERVANRILDFYGGLDDLRNGIIRVLHSISFIDDPTRVLRAVRFEQRLNFQIEPRTAELIETAHPMLERITGERIRNELTLLLKEPMPEQGFRVMQQRGILQAIHPGFLFTEATAEGLYKARTLTEWPTQPEDMTTLLWHILFTQSPLDQIEALGERLLFSNNLSRSFKETAMLIQEPGVLLTPDAATSEIARRLDDTPEMALLAAWVLHDDLPRQRIAQYLTEWRHITTKTNGNTLKEMGVTPGPHYRIILNRLREARLDGEIMDDNTEYRYLRQLLKEYTDGGN